MTCEASCRLFFFGRQACFNKPIRTAAPNGDSKLALGAHFWGKNDVLQTSVSQALANSIFLVRCAYIRTVLEIYPHHAADICAPNGINIGSFPSP